MSLSVLSLCVKRFGNDRKRFGKEINKGNGHTTIEKQSSEDQVKTRVKEIYSFCPFTLTLIHSHMCMEDTKDLQYTT